MWNCQWLLCLVVICLATRGASSMNETPRMKNDSQKTRGNDESSLPLNSNSEEERKSQNEPSLRDRDETLHPSPATTATAVLAANLTTSNTTAALEPEAVAGTSINAGKLGPHDQFHSKRHFHRSKLYRKEVRAKSRASLSKNSMASGDLIPFSTGHSASPSQDLFHNPDHNRDPIKLLESTPKASGTSSSRTRSVTTSRDDLISTASSRSLFTNGSKDTSDDSSSTENSDNLTSSSSEAGSMIDEKSSSVELMAFTFDNVDGVRSSTSPNKVVKQLENSTASSSIAIDRSSSSTVITVQTSDRSIDKATSVSADLNYGGIDHGQFIRKGVAGTDDESNSTTLENNSNHNQSDVEEHSWVSLDDSLNRISLARVVDTLKNVALKGTRGSYSYSNSSVSQDLGSKMTITDTGLISAKHSRSLTFPDVAESPRESSPSISGAPEMKSSDPSYALPVSTLTEKIESPMKLKVPLIIDAMAKARTENNIAVEDVDLSKPSTSTDFYSRQKSLVTGRKDGPLRLVLDPDSLSAQCSSDSSTEGLRNVRRIDSENLFHQRHSNEAMSSGSGNSIPDSEQWVTKLSSASTAPHSTREPDRPIEALDSSVIPLNPEEEDVSVSLPVNESHAREAETTKSPQSAIDGNRGAQNLVSSGFIFLDALEPVVHESLASFEEAAVPFESETATTEHFFTAFADLEEHCNASSYNIFLPHVNSRENVAAVNSEENPSLASHKPQNLTTTEDSLYIIEGFGFLKNGADDISELEEIFDRKRDASFDYSETENYPGYPQPDDHPPAVKLIDLIDFEAELPVKQEPRLIPTGLQWKGNVGDRNEDSWWFNNESKQRRGQVVSHDDFKERTVLIPSGFPVLKEDRVRPDINESNINNYRIFLLPTIYVLIGICVVLVGCSIWCSKLSVKRQPNSPKLTYFIQERQRATQAV